MKIKEIEIDHTRFAGTERESRCKVRLCFNPFSQRWENDMMAYPPHKEGARVKGKRHTSSAYSFESFQAVVELLFRPEFTYHLTSTVKVTLEDGSVMQLTNRQPGGMLFTKINKTCLREFNAARKSQPFDEANVIAMELTEKWCIETQGGPRLGRGSGAMKIQACLSSITDEWATPKFIYSQAMAKGMFDPCPLGGQIDGLAIEWGESNFVNPPYSQLKKWIKKSIEEHEKGRDVIMLIPARTDTKAFRMLFEYGCDITFITGRLRFNEAKTAPFPSMIAKLIGGGIKNTKCLIVDRQNVKI